MASPELAAFAAAKVDMTSFQTYLRAHELAFIVSRDVTTRDHADRLQPFNLRIPSSGHQTLGAGGKIYDIAFMQLFQADQLRSLNYGNPATPRAGRRVIAQYLHDPAVDNPDRCRARPSPACSSALMVRGGHRARAPSLELAACRHQRHRRRARALLAYLCTRRNPHLHELPRRQ